MSETDKPKVRKELGKNIFGTALREAGGSKKIRPGDPNTTSAKFLDKGESAQQAWTRGWMERLTAQAAKNESFLTEAMKKINKRGYRTTYEQDYIDQFRKTGGTT